MMIPILALEVGLLLLGTSAGTDLFIDGDNSGRGDDTKSVVRCPAGYTIKSCAITEGGVPNNSDGILINYDGEGTCTGLNSYLGHGTRVRGVCSLAVQEENPCHGPRLPVLVYQSTSNTEPHVTCPGGYEMIGCVYHSWWAPGISAGARARISHDGQVQFGDNTCSLPHCGENYCTTTAICQLTNTEEYRVSHCFDCEGYQCGDQEECVMDGDRPFCRTIQTGCDDNDRCQEWSDCRVTLKSKPKRAIRDSPFKIRIKGVKRKLLKKYGSIVWTKDGEPYNPDRMGNKLTKTGFKVFSFQPEDVGTYEANVEIDSPRVKERCSTTILVE